MWMEQAKYAMELGLSILIKSTDITDIFHSDCWKMKM